jgi:hypothetical protein
MILTIVALVLWSYSVSQAELIIGFYGLIHSFPITFFIALALLTIASAMLWVSPQSHGKLLCVQLCLLITALWLTPLLVGSNPMFSDISYRDFAFYDYITRYGHLNTAWLWYHAWPGLWMLQAASMEVLGTENPYLVATLGPFLMQFLILLPLYLFLKNTISQSNYRWAASWIFYLANWTAQIYIAPQGMTFFLFLILLALLSKMSLWERGGAVGNRLMTITVMACLPITHLFTSIAGFLSIALLWATRQLKVSTNLVIIATVFIGAATIYGAIVQLEFQLPHFLERAFRFDLLFKWHFVDPPHAASESHIAVRWVRVWFSALFAAIGIAGFILSRKLKSKADSTVLALSGVPIIMTFTALYGWELFMRTYLLALVPIAYFGVKLLNLRAASVVLCLLMLVALPLHIVAHHGNAARDHIPRGEIAYWHFIQDNIREGYLTGGLSPSEMRYAGYRAVGFDELEWDNNLLVGKPLNGDRPHYVNVGKWDQSAYGFLRNEPEFIPNMRARLENSTHYNLIYVNPDVSLFINEGQDQ